MGQDVVPGAVVTKGGGRDEPMRIGVVQTVNDEQRTAQIKWEFSARWWNKGVAVESRGYGGRPGNCYLDYLTVVDPSVLEALR